MKIRSFAAALVMAASSACAITAAGAADAKKGQQLLITYGCYGCHGYNGQGANTGVKLAPDPMPLEALTHYIRNSATNMMPPYSEKLVSNAEVADIHAWLVSQPKLDPNSIPLLKQ